MKTRVTPPPQPFYDRATRWIGSKSSLVLHTIVFIISFLFIALGVDADRVLLILTTVVSLEAIYLAIFIQITVNRNTIDIADIADDIDEIQEDVEGIEKDIDEIQEDVDEIQEDLEEINEDDDELNLQSITKKEVSHNHDHQEVLEKLLSEIKELRQEIIRLKHLDK